MIFCIFDNMNGTKCIKIFHESHLFSYSLHYFLPKKIQNTCESWRHYGPINSKQ